MNIPPVYLVEPYNAYAPKGRKKHWHEIIEEQNLMARIVAEQQALQEATSITLPPQSPHYSTPTVAGHSAGAGHGGAPGSGAGAGGTPVFDYFNQNSQIIGFTSTPNTGSAPLAVQFNNSTTGPKQYNSYLWAFGDGTTSTAENPSHVYNTGSFTASFQLSGSNGYTAFTTTSISASIPSISAAFTMTGSGGFFTSSAGNIVIFINGTTTTGAAPTYLWSFGSASLTSTSSNPAFTYKNPNTYTVTLAASGSYGISNLATHKVLML